MLKRLVLPNSSNCNWVANPKFVAVKCVGFGGYDWIRFNYTAMAARLATPNKLIQKPGP